MWKKSQNRQHKIWFVTWKKILLIGTVLMLGIIPSIQAQYLSNLFDTNLYYVKPQVGGELMLYRTSTDVGDEIMGDFEDIQLLINFSTEFGIQMNNHRLGIKVGYGINPEETLPIWDHMVEKRTYIGVVYNPYIFDRSLFGSSVHFTFQLRNEIGYYHYKGKYEAVLVSEEEYEAAGGYPIRSTSTHGVGGAAGLSLALGIHEGEEEVTLGFSPVNIVATSRSVGWQSNVYLLVAFN